MPRVHIPATLRQYTEDQASLEIPGRCIADVLAGLIELHPQLQQQLFFRQPAQLHAHLNLFVDRQNIRNLSGLQTPIEPEQELLILPALSGG